MKRLFRNMIGLLAIGLLGACSVSQATSIPAGFTENEAKTLASLKQVDDYPLYTMTYYGDYAPPRTSSLPAVQQAGSPSGWACSLFTVLLDEDHRLYGRNFDWEFSPALLLFTDPPNGYASVSMVDIAYLGFSKQTVSRLMDLPLEERAALLNAPQLPFDGMNEHGLAIGMAAVPPGNMQADPSKERIDSIGIIRAILDHARDVGEAVDLIREYDIDFRGGPPVHYLIADAKGKAVLVEFYQGEMHIFENEQPWHSATNFLRSSVEDPKGNCWRYDRINARLSEKQGMLDARSAMQLLSEVTQESTQWSVVYQMARGEVNVAMGRDYANVHTFQMSDYFGPR
ncbi:MAG TPA: C45 family peptidase [Anaerolineales bacterium]|nr:C45 family peptidase [Anaerolineales bacterium]